MKNIEELRARLLDVNRTRGQVQLRQDSLSVERKNQTKEAKQLRDEMISLTAQMLTLEWVLGMHDPR